MMHPIVSSIIRIERRRLIRLRGVLAPHNYVGVMHLILLFLHQRPGASQEEIARFYTLDKGGVARDTFRLEAMGHLRRETDPNDRRRQRLYVTPAGEEMLSVIFEADAAFFADLSRGMSQKELDALVSLLKRLEDNCCPPAPEKGEK